MQRIGLTGGIGSGKSTVAELFAARGVPIIDADVIARELVAPGQPALAAIVTAFGSEILNAEGALDRVRLRERVFADSKQRLQLEAILHPRIRAEMTTHIAILDASYVMLVIPLLFEAAQTDMVDRVLVVDVSPEVQRERVAARDALSQQQIEAILTAQLDREHRIQRADDVIDNSGDLAALEQQVDTLHRKYLALPNKDSPL